MLVKFKQQYQAIQKTLIDDYQKGVPVVELMQYRSGQIDALLEIIWRHLRLDKSLCIVAVGGYGRAELCLYSDIDLLILLPSDTHQKYQESIGNFLSFLWDIGLEVGHSTRDIKDCKTVITDLSIVTNMLESRYLFGNKDLFTQIPLIIKNSDWQSQSFLVAKQKELSNRYQKYADSAYGLEPNIKESPGGLRDIQTLLWVTKWHLGLSNLDELLAQNFLTKNEYTILAKQQDFLWHLRFGLHIISRRKEDRINFSAQRKLATFLGFVDSKNMIAVEQMMRGYYQAVGDISRMSDILMQSLEQAILYTQILSPNFSIKEGYLRTNRKHIFAYDSSAILKIFLLCTQHNYIKGIQSSLLRELLDNLSLINDQFRKDPKNADIFMSILRAKQGVNFALHLMSRYGVMARYIPEFSHISGLMQYDLFHKFTVDQHTLFLVRNLRRFFIDEHAKEFQLCHNIAIRIKQPELLILAGLFHDIAKGRGGDHAQLGSIDALKFCQNMGLSQYDSNLVSWLVEQHLLMSSIAQKQDLTDPEVILEFTKIVSIKTRLDYLYLLTVADIRATNKELWNDWKDNLLKQLYHATHSLLRKGLEQSQNQTEVITDAQHTITDKLVRQGVSINQIKDFFNNLPLEYFVRYSPDEIIWHYQLISKHTQDKTMIAFYEQQEGKMDIFIYTSDKPCVFLTMISILEALSLSILEARVVSSCLGKTFNTMSISSAKTLDLDRIRTQLLSKLTVENPPKISINHRTKAHQHFDSKTHVNISQNSKKQYSIIEVTTMDRHGVLSLIMSIFCDLNLSLLNARIATFGERVEDIFFVINQNNKPLNKSEKNKLEKTIMSLL